MYNDATISNLNIFNILFDHNVEKKIMYKVKDWNLIQMQYLIW